MSWLFIYGRPPRLPELVIYLWASPSSPASLFLDTGLVGEFHGGGMFLRIRHTGGSRYQKIQLDVPPARRAGGITARFASPVKHGMTARVRGRYPAACGGIIHCVGMADRILLTFISTGCQNRLNMLYGGGRTADELLNYLRMPPSPPRLGFAFVVAQLALTW